MLCSPLSDWKSSGGLFARRSFPRSNTRGRPPLGSAADRTCTGPGRTAIDSVRGFARAGDLVTEFLEGRGVDDFPLLAAIPGPARVGFATIADAGGIVEVLVDEVGGRWDPADGELGLAHA